MIPKVAFLIDGGYFLKRLPSQKLFNNQNNSHERVDLPPNNPAKYVANVDRALNQLVNGHLRKLNQTYRLENWNAMLFRIFFYDAPPYTNREHYPKSGETINFKKSPQAKIRNAIFEKIKSKRNYALRLGHITRESGWNLRPKVTEELIRGSRTIADLKDEDFALGLRQKGVDMRIGIDIATLALKNQVDIIVLVSGDSDFVPAAKLARREGLEFILDPLGQNIKADLSEHIDSLYWGLKPPPSSDSPDDMENDDS